MRYRRSLLICCEVLSVVVIAGCGTNPVAGMGAPDHLTLYSLDGKHRSIQSPDESQEEKQKDIVQEAFELFHEFPVLGKAAIDDPARRAEIMSAFKQGIERSDGTMNKCFWPRHGIRVTKDKQTIDYVICFECLQFEVHDGSITSRKPITRDPQTLLNAILKEKGVPLPPSADAENSDETETRP